MKAAVMLALAAASFAQDRPISELDRERFVRLQLQRELAEAKYKEAIQSIQSEQSALIEKLCLAAGVPRESLADCQINLSPSQSAPYGSVIPPSPSPPPPPSSGK